jgi:WD40 repeat protein
VYNASLSLINSFQAHTNMIVRIKQLPNGYVATCSADSKAKIWDVLSNSTNWILIRTHSGHSNNVYAVEYINEDLIATGAWDNTIQIWFLSTGIINRTINTPQYVNALQLLNNNVHLAAGLATNNINIYNINDGSLVSTLIGHTNWINDLILISNNFGSLLASSSYDQTVRIWNLTTNTQVFSLTGHTNQVYGLKLVTTNVLASGCQDNSIKLWNLTSGQEIRTFTGHTSFIWWSVDLMLNDVKDQILVSGSWDQTIKFWNLTSGECFKTVNTGIQIRALNIITSNKLSMLLY